MMINISEKLSELISIVESAGEKILEIYNGPDFYIETKEDNSPLTLADREANEIICKGLARLYPDIPIVSEENKEIDYSERKDFEYCWCVDPLDGTKEFIKRNGDFTVNVALIHNGYPVFGCVYIPVEDQTYYAVKGEGAFRFKNGMTESVSTKSYSEADKGLRIVCSRSHLNEETRSFIEKYQDCELVSRGSSLKFIIIAEGKAEIYPRIAPTMEWDTAAAQVILEEAGGEVINYETQERLSYNKESLLNPYFIARAKKID